MLEPWKEGQIGNQLGKVPIESGMSQGGSDIIPSHVPGQHFLI